MTRTRLRVVQKISVGSSRPRGLFAARVALELNKLAWPWICIVINDHALHNCMMYCSGRKIYVSSDT